MKYSKFKKAVELIQSIVLQRRRVDYPNLSRKKCITALKKIFKRSNINDIADYIKKESQSNYISDLEKVLLYQHAKDLFYLDNRYVPIDNVIYAKNENENTNDKTYILNTNDCNNLNMLNKNIAFYKNITRNEIYPYNIDIMYHNLYTLQGHVAYANCIIFISKNILVTAADDKIIKLWDITEGILITSLVKHEYPITDICASMDNEYLISCDSGGFMVIWSLRSFKVVHTREMNGSIELVEFVGIDKAKKETENICNSNDNINNCDGKNDSINKHTNTEDTIKYKSNNGNHDSIDDLSNQISYNIVAISHHGCVQFINFTKNTCVLKTENNIMTCLGDDETIRAICISEGGRFLLTGGFWPFLLLFDTHNLHDNVFALETNGNAILSVCASKNKTKFAASTTNSIYEWEYHERNRNIKYQHILYKKKIKTVFGREK